MTMLTGFKSPTASISKAVTIPKAPAAPLSAWKLLCTITNPLASAKSAMDQMRKNKQATAAST